MSEVWPAENLKEQQRERVRVHSAGQHEARAPRSALRLHGLQQHLQLLLLDLLQHRVRERLQFGLRTRTTAAAATTTTGGLGRFAHAQASVSSSASSRAVRPGVRRLLPVAVDGRAAPPESPDEPRPSGPEHARRRAEGLPAKERAWRPQIMK